MKTEEEIEERIRRHQEAIEEEEERYCAGLDLNDELVFEEVIAIRELRWVLGE